MPSHYLGVVDNYNKEMVIATNKVTRTNGITETIKIPLLKLLYTCNIYIYNNYIYIYIYIYIYLYIFIYIYKFIYIEKEYTNL